jgi:hypothetical protein
MSELPLLTYLKDHAAGAEAACGLLERLADRYAEEPLGTFFLGLLTEIRADRQTLLVLIDEIGGGGGTIKSLGGRLAEKFSRLKLQLGDSGTDSLGLFEALEVLGLGILGKRSLWRALQKIADRDERLSRLDLATLEARAERQFEDVERQRLTVAVNLLPAGTRG